MSIGYGDLRKGMAIDLDGEPHIVVEYESRKMQQRAPVMRVRFRAIRSGRVVDKTFNGYDVKLTPAAVERRNAQFIYEEDDLYYFMDDETYDQFPLSKDSMPDALPFLIEQMTVEMVFYEDNPIAIDRLAPRTQRRHCHRRHQTRQAGNRPSVAGPIVRKRRREDKSRHPFGRVPLPRLACQGLTWRFTAFPRSSRI